MPSIIVICGAPAAGKTTLARALRDVIAWPLLAKDDVKEVLFGALGWSDRAHSKRVSAAAYAVMFTMAKELAQTNRSCILEGNFRWHERQADFAALTAAHRLRMLQVFVTASPAVLARRFEMRTGLRHAGHVDQASAAEILRELREEPARPLPLDCDLVELRTDESDAEAVAAVVARVKEWAAIT